MAFRRLRKRGRDRARSSERRRLGKAFQKDGPTTAKLLCWAVVSLILGTTRPPCSAERRDLRPGKDDTGVTGQNIPPAGSYPGLKRPRLDYTRVYYGIGQFIPRGILWPRPIHTPSGQIISLMISITISIVFSDIPNNYLIFQRAAEDSILTGALSEKA